MSFDTLEEKLRFLRQAWGLLDVRRHVAYGEPGYTEQQRREINTLIEELREQFRQTIVVELWNGIESGIYQSALNWCGHPCFIEVDESVIQKRLYRCRRESESMAERTGYEKSVKRDDRVKSRGYKRQQRSGKNWNT